MKPEIDYPFIANTYRYEDMKHELGYPFIGEAYHYEHLNDNVKYRRLGIIGVGVTLLLLTFIFNL